MGQNILKLFGQSHNHHIKESNFTALQKLQNIHPDQEQILHSLKL